MLNTNQSNRKNIWKYLIIVPIITVFIYLFQVEVVAQERKKIEINKNQNFAVVDSAVAVGIGYITNKYSTDEEMKNDAVSLMKDYNIDYKFSNIKRNEKDEIIAIKIEFNDNKGHKGEKVVNGTDPIQPIHFTVDVDKSGKEKIGFYKYEFSSSDKHFVSDIISKDKSDTEILSGLSIFEEENVFVEVSNVKRNAKKEITAIKIVAKDSDNKEVEYEQISDDVIEDIFIIKEVGGKNKFTIKSKKELKKHTLKSNTESDKKAPVKSNFAPQKSITNNETKVFKEIEKSKSSQIDAIAKEKEINTSISQSDVAPEPQNGMQEFRKYIAKNFRLPEVEKNVDATIVTKFIVSKTGEILDITFLSENPKNLGLSEELTRILKESPKWKPGTKDGKPADIYFVLPVSIRIEATKK